METYPFPHTVIDNFLPNKLFKKLNDGFKKKGKIKR